MVGSGAMKKEDVAWERDEKTEREKKHEGKRKEEDKVQVAQKRTRDDKKEKRMDTQKFMPDRENSSPVS
jgi:hypothetical protein